MRPLVRSLSLNPTIDSGGTAHLHPISSWRQREQSTKSTYDQSKISCNNFPCRKSGQAMHHLLPVDAKTDIEGYLHVARLRRPPPKPQRARACSAAEPPSHIQPQKPKISKVRLRRTLIPCSSPDRGPGGSLLPVTTELAMLACYRHPHTRS